MAIIPINKLITEHDLNKSNDSLKLNDIVESIIKADENYEDNKKLVLSKCNKERQIKIKKRLDIEKPKEDKKQEYKSFMKILEFYFKRDSFLLCGHLVVVENKTEIISDKTREEESNINLELFIKECTLYKQVAKVTEKELFVRDLFSIITKFYDNTYLHYRHISPTDEGTINKRQRQKDIKIIDNYERLILNMKRQFIEESPIDNEYYLKMIEFNRMIDDNAILKNMINDTNNKRYKIKLLKKKRTDLEKELKELFKAYSLNISDNTIKEYLNGTVSQYN